MASLYEVVGEPSILLLHKLYNDVITRVLKYMATRGAFAEIDHSKP